MQAAPSQCAESQKCGSGTCRSIAYILSWWCFDLSTTGIRRPPWHFPSRMAKDGNLSIWNACDQGVRSRAVCKILSYTLTKVGTQEMIACGNSSVIDHFEMSFRGWLFISFAQVHRRVSSNVVFQELRVFVIEPRIIELLLQNYNQTKVGIWTSIHKRAIN